MLIDFHTHAFPEAIAAKAIAKLSREGGNLTYYTDGTYEGLSKAAKDAGLSHYVVLPIAVKPNQMRTVNDAAFARQDEYAIEFASVHPFGEDVLDEVKRIKEMGFLGVKMHPEYQDFFVDDERVFPVYEALGSAGLITVFHAGYDLGFFGEAKAAPQRMQKALPHFLGAPVIAAHMGGHADWMNVLTHLAGLPGLYFDTSFSHTHLPPLAAMEIIKKHGADHILFASDSPWSDIKAEKSYIDSLPLSHKEKQQIFYENGAKLLKINDMAGDLPV